MTGERFLEIWLTRRYGDIPKDVMTGDEKRTINLRWAHMPGDRCWMDAFMAEWRIVDPEGHKAIFAKTFYETEQSMRVEDEPEEISR